MCKRNIFTGPLGKQHKLAPVMSLIISRLTGKLDKYLLDHGQVCGGLNTTASSQALASALDANLFRFSLSYFL